MSALRYAPPVNDDETHTITARANLAFDGYRRGEVLDVDPVLCARYLELGWLSQVDDDGQRVIPDGPPGADAHRDQAETSDRSDEPGVVVEDVE